MFRYLQWWGIGKFGHGGSKNDLFEDPRHAGGIFLGQSNPKSRPFLGLFQGKMAILRVLRIKSRFSPKIGLKMVDFWVRLAKKNTTRASRNLKKVIFGSLVTEFTDPPPLQAFLFYFPRAESYKKKKTPPPYFCTISYREFQGR